MKNTNENLEEEYSGPSKSELKRRAEHLQDLGKELTTLGAETLAKIELPEVILKAIEDYHRVPSFGAKRRQLQLIGKYMRALDGDAVRQAIDRATGNDKAAVAALHKSERLRDALIADDAALTKFIAQFPDVNVQEVRQLIRNRFKHRCALTCRSRRQQASEIRPRTLQTDLRNGSSSDRVGSHRGGRR